MAVDLDRAAIAMGLIGAVIAFIANWSLDLTSGVMVWLVRSSLTFVGVWIGTFVCLWLLRRHFIDAINAPPEIEELPEETAGEEEASEKSDKQGEVHEDVA